MLQRNKIILWRELDQGVVLLDPLAGCSYTLNTTGAFIWKKLDGNCSPNELATALCGNDIGTYEQALQDVDDILAALREHNLATESITPAQDMASQHL